MASTTVVRRVSAYSTACRVTAPAASRVTVKVAAPSAAAIAAWSTSQGRAPLVGASLEVMERDAKKMRGPRPFVFSNLKTGQGLDAIVKFIETEGMLCEAQPQP